MENEETSPQFTQAPGIWDLEKGFKLGTWKIFPWENELEDEQQQRVKLTQKSMALLLCLVRHQREVVSKETLLKELWDDRAMSDMIISVNMSHLRKALGEKASSPKLIKTVHGKGYLCMASPVPLQAPSLKTDSPKTGALSKVKAFVSGWLLALVMCLVTALAAVEWKLVSTGTPSAGPQMTTYRIPTTGFSLEKSGLPSNTRPSATSPPFGKGWITFDVKAISYSKVFGEGPLSPDQPRFAGWFCQSQ